MFDVEKAYDKLWHAGLYRKLRKIGFCTSTISLIINFLTDREIRLKVNSTYSNPVALKSGTAQGAILSCAIFNIWVHDIPQPQPEEPCKLSQFADDIASWCNGHHAKTVMKRLQAYNDRLMKWCQEWRIKLSAKKTQVIYFKRDQLPRNFVYQKIGGKIIYNSEEVEFLGVKLDRTLTLSKHHEKQSTEMKRRIRLLHAIAGSQHRAHASSEICVKILNVMIKPVCQYAPLVSCVMPDAKLTEWDLTILKGGRIALHAPMTVSGNYVKQRLKYTDMKTTITALATEYATDDKRSPSFQKAFYDYQPKTEQKKWKTPLDIIKKPTQRQTTICLAQ